MALVSFVDWDWVCKSRSVLAQTLPAFDIALVEFMVGASQVVNGLRVVGRSGVGGQPIQVRGYLNGVVRLRVNGRSTFAFCWLCDAWLNMFIICYIAFYLFKKFSFGT